MYKKLKKRHENLKKGTKNFKKGTNHNSHYKYSQEIRKEG